MQSIILSTKTKTISKKNMAEGEISQIAQKFIIAHEKCKNIAPTFKEIMATIDEFLAAQRNINSLFFIMPDCNVPNELSEHLDINYPKTTLTKKILGEDINGQKKDQLTLGNLKSVANQLIAAKYKPNLIICDVATEDAEAIIFMLFALIVAQKNATVICRIPEKLNNAAVAALHFFTMHFIYVQLIPKQFIIGQGFLNSAAPQIYEYIKKIIDNQEDYEPIYKSFEFLSMLNFIDSSQCSLKNL